MKKTTSLLRLARFDSEQLGYFSINNASFVSDTSNVKGLVPSTSPVISKRIKPKIPSLSDIEKITDSNILGVGESPQNIRPMPKNMHAGKFFTFNPKGQDLYEDLEVEGEDLHNIPVLVSCGLGGGYSKKTLFDSWLPFQQLLSINPEDIAVYSSLNEGESSKTRFQKGLPYYYDESYINQEESENFFEKFLKLRFFNKDDSLKNLDEISPLLLLNFSIGYRETKSHMNFLYQKVLKVLEKEGIDLKEVSKIFDKIQSINVASPVNWSNKKLPNYLIKELENGNISVRDIENYMTKEFISFDQRDLFQLPSPEQTISVRSIFDKGTAKPVDDFNNFHRNHKLFQYPVNYFERQYLNNPIKKDEMTIIKDTKLYNISFCKSGNSIYLKNNSLGHNLPNYTEAMSNSSAQHLKVERFKDFLLNIKSEQVEQNKNNIPKIEYQIGRIPTEIDNETLINQWYGDYFLQVSFMRAQYDQTEELNANNKHKNLGASK